MRLRDLRSEFYTVAPCQVCFGLCLRMEPVPCEWHTDRPWSPNVGKNPHEPGPEGPENESATRTGPMQLSLLCNSLSSDPRISRCILTVNQSVIQWCDVGVVFGQVVVLRDRIAQVL